jgi:long-chain acyl-CoA synthetase
MAPDIVCLSDIPRMRALVHPDRDALQDATASNVVTYGALWSRVERGAAALRQRGLTAGDRVLVTLAPGTDWMPAFLAIVHARLVAVLIPADTPVDRSRLAAMFAGVRAWIGQPGDAEREAALSHVSHIRPSDLNKPDIAVRADDEADPAATAVLVFTSGSTSRPRAVALSHRNILANLRALLTSRQPVPDEAVLSTLPPSHAYELVAGQLAPLAAGARIVYSGVPLPNRLIDVMRTQRITRAALVPALFEALAREVIDGLVDAGAAASTCRHLSAADLATRVRTLDSDGRTRLRDEIRERIGTAFHAVVIGGAASHPAWAEILTAVGIHLDVGYGLTEAGPVVAMGRAGECPAGSVGRPLTGVRVRISQEDEVLVWSESIMQGYAGDRDGTDATLEDGWLRTGDRGRLDADGFLFITGRIKEAMVTSAGETIYPDEVEQYFASPLFAELAVVPAPGDEGNDRPMLVVVPADPAANVAALTKAALSLNAAAPARLRVSGVIVRVDPLPRTAVGKVRRRVIADAISAEKATS